MAKVFTPFAWCLAALFVASGQVSLADTEVTLDTLKEVCSSSTKAKPIYFSSPQKVKSLLALNNENPTVCDQKFRGSFEALEKMLTSSQVMSDICGPEAYNHIRNFHNSFISYYGPEASREELEQAKATPDHGLRPIPESLRQFFILFALQTNASCKRQLVARLEKDVSKRMLKDEDFEVLDQFKYERSRLLGYNYVESTKGKFKKLKILQAIRFRDPNDESSKLYVEVRFGDAIKKIKDACANKFQPIYDELFTPVIMLNNLGYVERTHSKQEDMKIEEEPKFIRWYDIISSCELFRDIEVIQDTSASSAIGDLVQAASLFHQQQAAKRHEANGGGLQTVKILSRQEAEELKERIRSRIEKETEACVYRANPIKFPHKSVAFTPRMWSDGDGERLQEVTQFEKRVAKLIRKETSFLLVKRRDTAKWIKRTFYKNKLQFKNKDQESAIGRFASFVERHKTELQIFSVVMMVIVISLHVG